MNNLISIESLFLMREIDGERNLSAVSLAARMYCLEMLGETFQHSDARASLASLYGSGLIERKPNSGGRKWFVIYELTERGRTALRVAQIRFRLLSDLCPAI